MIDWMAIIGGAGLLFLIWLVARQKKPKMRKLSPRDIERIERECQKDCR